MQRPRGRGPGKDRRKRSSSAADRPILRSPDLLISWKEAELFVANLRNKRRVTVSPEVVAILNFFGRPRKLSAAAKAFSEYGSRAVARTIRKLMRLGVLLPEAEARRGASRLKVWKSNIASAQYHVACRDLVYFYTRRALARSLRHLVKTEARPACYKRYPSAFRRRLPRPEARVVSSASFGEVLDSRRTVRRFSPTPARFSDLAAVVGGTWGQTGWIVGEILGRQVIKTSPSAGALHPIECYVLAWNVRGLAPGLFHYDVATDELRRLRAGNLSAHAVRAASGQTWIRGAAFLCVMTAVFTRTLWKYEGENAYRSVWLDAGHLAQTFCLLATARGLGPFTTAAIQDAYIERLIGLDGVKEFPVYLCGAGVPAKPLLRT